MKKIILASALLLLSAASAVAQEVENPVGRFSIIPRIGVALANWSDNNIMVSENGGEEIKSKKQAGFLGGLDVEYRASEYIGVSLGAYYARQGFRYPDFEEVTDADKKLYVGTKNQHVNLDYIQVPLMLKAYVTRQLVAQVGVQAGFLCGDGKFLAEETELEKDKDGSTIHKDTKSISSTWPAKKVDFSIPLGLSYEYMNVILDARYNLGLTKVNKDDVSKSKNNVLTFTVGYRFTL